jgi:hypothetical protein
MLSHIICCTESFSQEDILSAIKKSDIFFSQLDDFKAYEIAEYLDVYAQALSLNITMLKEDCRLRSEPIYISNPLVTNSILNIKNLSIKKNIFCFEVDAFYHEKDIFSYYFFNDKPTLECVQPILCV